MTRSLAATLFALVMMGSLAVPVQADTIPDSGTVTGNSTLTPTGTPGVFSTNFTGSGADSVFGAFSATNTGTTTFNSTFTSFITTGTFMDVFAGGTVFGTFYETGTVTGTTSTITIHTKGTSGTGIFAGDTGASIVIGTNTSTNNPMFSGTYKGFFTTPEPSSLALMLTGIGLLPLMRKRLARGGQAP